MTLQGHIKNGVIVPDDPVELPEGATVQFQVLTAAPSPHDKPTEREIPTLYERLKPFVGSLEGLPADASVNIDHYLYGAPKRT
jgi:hypothetical protein